MEKLLLIAFIFVTISINTSAIAKSEANIDALISEGLASIYNLDFDAASEKFLQVQKSYPNDIRGFYYESLIYFYDALTSKSEVAFEKFMSRADKIIDMSDNLLDKDENNFDVLYCKGQTHSYKSLLLLLLNKNILKAASNGNDGYSILSDIIKRKPDYYDAYMGLGLFKIAIGYVPDNFKWLLNVIGFDGDIKDGRGYLKIAMQNGKFTRTEAKAYLAVFSLREKDFNSNEAIELTKSLVVDFPNSPFFNLLYGSILTQSGLLDEAIVYLNKSLELNKYSMQTEIKKSANLFLGNAYFGKNDFSKAITYLEEYMKLSKETDRYNLSLFTLAVSYEMIGRRDVALIKYRQIRPTYNNEKDGETEKLFYRIAQNRLLKRITPLDSMLVVGMNFRDSKQYEQSANTFSDIANSGLLKKYNDPDAELRYYYELGKLNLETRNFDKAKDALSKAVSIKPDKEIWLLPHSYFELAKLYSHLGDYNKADEYFEKVSDFDDFDLEQFLDMRITNYKKNKPN